MTMLEKVAQAICVAEGDDPDSVGEKASRDGLPVPDHAFPRWMSYLPAARAAIKAMREPDDAMVEVGSQAYYDGGSLEPGEGWDGSVADIWQAMIDHVLAEAPK